MYHIFFYLNKNIGIIDIRYGICSQLSASFHKDYLQKCLYEYDAA